MGPVIALLLLQGFPADGVADEDDLPDDAGEIIDGDPLAEDGRIGVDEGHHLRGVTDTETALSDGFRFAHDQSGELV
jgi:hypothetical protein